MGLFPSSKVFPGEPRTRSYMAINLSYIYLERKYEVIGALFYKALI